MLGGGRNVDDQNVDRPKISERQNGLFSWSSTEFSEFFLVFDVLIFVVLTFSPYVWAVFFEQFTSSPLYFQLSTKKVLNPI